MVMSTESARDAESKARIFISYSHKDMAFTDRLESALKERGFEPLIDRSEIFAFEDWWHRIEALIGRADTVVFVLSPDAVTSEVALKEMAQAASLNKRFAPIVCRRVDDSAVPEALRRLNFILFDDPDHFDASANKLAEALQTDIGWIRRHTEFGEAAHLWAVKKRPSGLLLRPPLLEEAEYWSAYRPHGAPLPTKDTQSFISDSRKAETAARVRRRRIQILIYILLVGIIGGLIGWINQAYIKEQWRWYAVTLPYRRTEVRPYVLPATKEQTLKPGDIFTECASNCPQMVVVPAGQFVMGSPKDELGHTDAEEPQHAVTITKPFAVSKYEVTFAEWDTCATYGGCDPNISDGGRGRGNQPVINVNWDDAKSYVAWLSLMTGKTYRLLSEAEWEYSARAGTRTAYYWGNDVGTNNAACDGCDSEWDAAKPAPVGSFAPNQFGIYDMEGNVWEWTEDCLHSNYDGAPIDGSAWTENGCTSHIVRGGSWLSGALLIRNANRIRPATGDRGAALGFRIARTLNP